MTRILFLPDEQTMLMIDSHLPAAQLAQAINNGIWQPPESIAVADRTEYMTLRAVFLNARIIAVIPADRASLLQAPVRLTRRQLQVLQCIVRGMTAKQIARRLGLHPNTTALHIANLKKRLGADTLAQSVERAATLGLLSDDTPV